MQHQPCVLTLDNRHQWGWHRPASDERLFLSKLPLSAQNNRFQYHLHSVFTLSVYSTFSDLLTSKVKRHQIK